MKIAISGRSGCGNTTVSKIISRKLDYRHINYTFRTMAKEQGIDFDAFCKMAKNDSQYDIDCDTRQKQLATEGDCVVGSRLAVWLIKDADLKIFLDASMETRASRIHKREGGIYQDVLENTKARDRSDTARYRNLYGINNNDHRHVDLTINTEHFTAEEVAGLVLTAVSMREEN